MAEHGQLGHVEIPADDPDRAKRFYGELFGWQFQETEGFEGYHMFRAGPGEVGGAVAKRGEMARDAMTQYVSVDSIDDVAAKVRDLGGEVLVPRTEVTGMGWYGVLRDSEGNEIGLWEEIAQTPA
jgi:predicted enzyme related to lactoylglutathione lyase